MTKRMYQSKNVAFTFLPHGDIKLIKSGDIMINQIEATEFDVRRTVRSPSRSGCR